MQEPLKGYLISQQSALETQLSSLKMITHISQLPQSNCDFLVIDSEYEYCTLSLISSIRQQANFQLIPIFFIGELKNPVLIHVLDGAFDEKALDIAAFARDKLILIKDKSSDDHDFERLLINYAYLRNNFCFTCILNYQDPAGFYYPLLQILFPNGSSADFWLLLENMESRKLLTHQQMVDEIQTCAHCHSGLLNFKNCCPNCGSNHISTQSFVHCFTCGNMGPIPEFLREGELTCSRCHASLRHIGIDYDKPMEDKICQQCKFYFFEASVKAVCMVCGKLSAPEQLESRRLYEYSNSSRAKAIAQGVELSLIVELGQFLQLIDLSIFKMIINWQLIIVKRYKELHFSMASLNIKNEEELINSYGLLKTEKLIMDFFGRIRALLRDSDLIARDISMIVFFLPMTPAKGCLTLLERIHSFTKTQFLENMSIKVQIGMMHSSELLEKNMDLDLLLNELYHQQIKYD